MQAIPPLHRVEDGAAVGLFRVSADGIRTTRILRSCEREAVLEIRPACA